MEEKYPEKVIEAVGFREQKAHMEVRTKVTSVYRPCKTYRGRRGITPLILDLAIGSEWLASRSGRFIPGERTPLYPVPWETVWAQS
jgi:hypothetical protein